MVKKLCIMLLVIGWGVSVSTMHAMMRIPCALFAARFLAEQRQRQAIVKGPKNTKISRLQQCHGLFTFGLSSESQEETLQEYIGESETPVSESELEEVAAERVKAPNSTMRCLR